jgi:ABC-type transport system involved in multi-copper enzyme maturation permease subunit
MITRIRDLVKEELKRVVNNIRNVVAIFAFILFVSLFPVIMFVTNLSEIPVERNITIDTLVYAFIRVYFFTYTVSLAVFTVFTVSMDIFISDKKEKALDVLLALPVSLRTIWLAKSITLFIISYLASVIATCIFIISINLFLMRGFIYLPDILMWLYEVTVLPIIIFLIISLTSILQLALKRYTVVNFSLFLVAFIVTGVPSFLISRLSQLNTSTYFWIYVGIAIILAMLNALIQRVLLDKERIILSS